jgi:cytochrome b561
MKPSPSAKMVPVPINASPREIRIGLLGCSNEGRVMGDSAMRTQYGATARILHWLTVLLVVVAWAMARYGEQLFDEGIDALHTATAIGLGLHLWGGLAILAIAIFRFRWRIANPPPPSPETNEFGRWLISWTDPSARLTHYVLYTLLFAVPIVGILLLFSEGKVLSAFGLADIAPWFRVTRGIARSLRELHVLLANVLVIVVAFHVATAVLHHVVFGDNALARMVPWLRRSDPK